MAPPKAQGGATAELLLIYFSIYFYSYFEQVIGDAMWCHSGAMWRHLITWPADLKTANSKQPTANNSKHNKLVKFFGADKQLQSLTFSYLVPGIKLHSPLVTVLTSTRFQVEQTKLG